MVKFILILIFGIGQVLMTEQLINNFNNKEIKKTLLFLGAKFLAYIIGIGIVVARHTWNIGSYLCMFLGVVSITAIVLFIYRTMYKK